MTLRRRYFCRVKPFIKSGISRQGVDENYKFKRQNVFELFASFKYTLLFENQK